VVRVPPVTVMVDYTTILDRPGVPVESPTQQGVECVVEVTTASSITGDGSGNHPSASCSSEGSVLWSEPSSSSPSGSPPGPPLVAPPTVGASCGGAGRLQQGNRGAAPHGLHLLLRRGGRALLLPLLTLALLLLTQAVV
jgi:hypothetical protein